MTSDTTQDSMGSARHSRRHLLIVIGVALVLRLAVFGLIYGVRHAGPGDLGGGDAPAYMAMAHYIYATGAMSNTLFLPRPPLFPALAALLYSFTGENVWGPIVLNFVMGVLTCAVIYQLARAVGQSPRWALIAGLIAAVYPAMLLSSVSFLTEAPFLLFYALALLLLARFIAAPNWRDLLLAAATLACATLTRLITLALPALLVILLFALIARRDRRWVQYAAVFVFISALPWAVLTFRSWYYNGIATPSTTGQWVLLFMRATSSERRVTGEAAPVIYARYIQEIERRLGHTVPPLDSIKPEAIWGYFQPTPEMQTVISQMAIEKNLAYPQWYILNSFYGLYRIFLMGDEAIMPLAIHIPLQLAFVLLACVGLWQTWRRDRRFAWLLGLPALFALGTTIALETAVLDTRHGLPVALPMCVLAAQGIAFAWARWQARRSQRLAIS